MSPDCRECIKGCESELSINDNRVTLLHCCIPYFSNKPQSLQVHSFMNTPAHTQSSSRYKFESVAMNAVQCRVDNYNGKQSTHLFCFSKIRHWFSRLGSSWITQFIVDTKLVHFNYTCSVWYLKSSPIREYQSCRHQDFFDPFRMSERQSRSPLYSKLLTSSC